MNDIKHNDYSNKTALVTGSTSGIGLAIAKSLLDLGCFVFLNYSRSDDSAQNVKSDLDVCHKGKFEIIKADLSSETEVDFLTEFVKGKVDKLDYIILNLGITCRGDFSTLTRNDWSRVINTNLSMPFFLLQNFDGMMGDYGRVVFIGSVLGIYPHSVSIPYGVTKAAIHFMVQTLVKYFATRFITVNAIAPGFVDTDWHALKSQELRKKIESKIALKRFATPSEISALCVSVIENDYI